MIPPCCQEKEESEKENGAVKKSTKKSTKGEKDDAGQAPVSACPRSRNLLQWRFVVVGLVMVAVEGWESPAAAAHESTDEEKDSLEKDESEDKDDKARSKSFVRKHLESESQALKPWVFLRIWAVPGPPGPRQEEDDAALAELLKDDENCKKAEDVGHRGAMGPW
eukprot:Skav202148  [mRNA]  locus=scaffold970:110190:112832:- [translate_table: standard]